MLTKEQKIEDWILGHYLSDYPENSSFNDVLEMLAEDDDRIIIWEPFEDWNGGYLADYMVEQYSNLIRLFNDIGE